MGFLLSDVVANAFTGVDKKVKTRTIFIKNLAIEAGTLVSQAQSVEIKEELVRINEAIRFSAPISNDSLSDIETQITLKFNELQNAVAQNDVHLVRTLANDLLILIKDRNNKCKLLK